MFRLIAAIVAAATVALAQAPPGATIEGDRKPFLGGGDPPNQTETRANLRAALGGLPSGLHPTPASRGRSSND